MKNIFDYAMSVKSATKICTQEEFEQLIDSPEVQSLCEQIANIPIGEDFHKWKDQINPIKKQLPILTPHAHFTDSHRSNKSGESSPWMTMDFDGIKDPESFWKTWLEPRVEELGIALAFISPSKWGVKVVSRLPEGMTREEAQAWFAMTIGIEDYDHTHDLARCVYLVPRSYLLLYKPELLFTASLPQPFSPLGETGVNTTGISTLSTRAGGEKSPQGEERGAYDPSLSIGGILYSDIIAAYFKKKYGGWPEVGHRHAALVSWVNAAFSLICDNDIDLMLKVTPRIKPDAEIAEIVSNVECYHKKHFKPYESKLLKQVLSELQAKKSAEMATDDEALLNEEMERELPPLPPPIKALVDICPVEFKIPMIVTSLVMFGELLCRLRSKLNTYETEFPGFFYVIEAPMGGGKRFIQIAKDLILKVAEQNDKAQEEIYNNWEEEKERHSSDSDYVAPPKPKPVYMMGPNKFSPSELIKEAMNNNGVGILSISEEIDTHTNSNKGGPTRDTSDLERIGWDGGTMKQRYAGQGTVYGSADLFLSFIFTGTPKAVDRAFPDAENGLVSRYIYDFIDTRFKEKPKFLDLSVKDKNMIARYAEKALRTCFDEEGNVMPIQTMDLRWALPAIDKWCEDYLHLSKATQNLALDAFRRRPPKMALRAMMVANWLWGNKKSHRQDVIDFGIWLADHAIDSQMKRFGRSFVEQAKVEETVGNQSVKQCKTEALLSILPDVFTASVLDEKKALVGVFTENRNIIYNYKKQGLVEKIDSKTYRKIIL